LCVVSYWCFYSRSRSLSRLLVQYALIAMAIWTFWTWLVAAVTTWYSGLLFSLGILVMLLLMTRVFTLLLTLFVTLFLARQLNDVFMHLMLRSIVLLLSITRLFMLVVTLFSIIALLLRFLMLS